MKKKYTEEELLLVLNFDSYDTKVLTLTERCRLHQINNDIYQQRKIFIEEYLSIKIANILTKIHHFNYQYQKKCYIKDEQTGKVILTTII